MIFKKKVYKIVYEYCGREYNMIVDGHSAAQAVKKFNSEMRGNYKVTSFDEITVGRG